MSAVSTTQVAISTPFDNASNDFTAEEVQSAIEEVRFIHRTINSDITIPTDKTWIQRNPVIVAAITILGTGELLVL